MAFVKNLTTVIHVEGGTVTVGKLSAKSLDKAREAEQINSARRVGQMSEGAVRGLFGTPEARQAAADMAAGRKPDYETAKRARYGQYDRGLVLLQGIRSWTFDEPPGQDPADQVDDETAQKIHEGILDFSLRPLDPAEYETARGKDFANSTGT